jgi:hypothetical protein
VQKGQPAYEVGGSLADGRKIYFRLASDGTLLRRETDVLPESAPEAVQNTIARAVGGSVNAAVREIYGDEQLVYQVGVKNETTQVKMVVAEDGTLLGFESRLKPPEKPH